MNLLHRWYCRSGAWARKLQGAMMPWALEGVELGEDVLEIGSGPGLSTDWLRAKVSRLTSIEIDDRLAASLQQRLGGTNVTVVEGDATDMSFPDASFSTVVCFTMLHHVPSAELQDRLLAEAFRVLRPGGVFAGSDSTPNLIWNLFHVLDTRVPVPPSTFAGRLQAAGFGEVEVERGEEVFRFRARRLAAG